MEEDQSGPGLQMTETGVKMCTISSTEIFGNPVYANRTVFKKDGRTWEGHK